MNSICLIGNICNDVELKTTNSGKSVCSFNLAVRRPFTKDTTDFFTIICWNKLAETVSMYCKKGTKVGVSGMLTSRKYQDKDNNNRIAIEVVASEVTFVDKKPEGQAVAKTEGEAVPSVAEAEFVDVGPEDDLPF